MTPRIALVCALPHHNPGMYSVDLAFDRVLDRHGRPAELRRYCYGGPFEASGLARHELSYASLEDHLDEVLDSDVILFWGDYQHAHSYWLSALRLRTGNRPDFADEQEEMVHVAAHLLLAGQPDEILAKTISFGTSLLGDDLRSTTTMDSAYRTALPSFVARARRIWCRDPISAAQVARGRPTGGEDCLGVDCAHLLSGDDYRAIAGDPVTERDYVGVFFGRLDAAMGGPQHLTAQVLSATGLEARWLPWLGTSSTTVDDFRAAIPQLTVDESHTYERLIARVSGARLVITDAYHLCLIAWRLGVPAVCLGLGAQRPFRPISDKKKEIFHLTQGISPLYVFHEELATPVQVVTISRSVVELALDAGYVDAVVSGLAQQAHAAERELWSAIESCLP